jgi:hypothetical protein
VRRARLLATVCVAVLCASMAPTGDAGAAGDSGASSRVVGRGNIVTSILGWSGVRARPTGATAPRCAWRTLTDAQLEWLVSVAGQAVGLGLRTPLLDPLAPYLDGSALPDGDLQGYVCGVDTYELRFVPVGAPQSVSQLLYRQMITRLPAPDPVTSPPAATVVPVGQPVFVSIPLDQWQPVEGTLSSGGITAQVRAEPVGLRVITGDPAALGAVCDGPGRPFRAGTDRSPAAQSRDPGACVVRYRTASAGHRAAGSGGADEVRPATWLGTVTVVWSAQWRVGDGPWVDLGEIPRTRLVARAARDLTTSVQTPG